MGTFNKKNPETGCRSALGEFTRLFRTMIDPYRPELHYMRGPGPKWHAKHMTVPAQEPVMHGLARIEG